MTVADTWEEAAKLAAATKTKTPKVRKPEEVWYDVHKHPEGVPGGMGKSPEHHLRNRGWTAHEINGSTSKTIQYHNPKHPDFVISYGGGSSTKPDHNFRVLYMGTNRNIPKVHRAYSVADAMNKVEELHQLQSGMVVQPMTHDSAYVERPPKQKDSPDLRYFQDTELRPRTVGEQFNDQAMLDFKPVFREGMDDASTYSPGDLCETCFLRDEMERSSPEDHAEYDHPFKPLTHDTGRRFSAANPTAAKPTVARQPSVKADKSFVAPATPPSRRDMNDDSAFPIGKPAVDFPTQPDKQSDWKKPPKQLQEIPDPPKVKPPKPPSTVEIKTTSRRTPDGPATIGRAEYSRRQRAARQAHNDRELSIIAARYGMDIKPEEVANYRGLRSVVAAFQRAERETWEEV